MSPVLADLLGLAQLWLGAGIAAFLRVGAAFLVLPALGEAFIPARVRLSAALAFAVLLAPFVATRLGDLAGRTVPPPSLFLTEAVAGLMIGIGLRLIVHALQIAGAMAAQATSLSQIAADTLPDPSPSIGNVLLLAGLTLAVISGLHVHVARAFLQSYDILPLGQFPLSRDAGAWGVARVGDSFALAFSLAAPFLIASLLYNMALGVINKAMPQLLVAFVGAPAITWGSMIILLLSAPFLLPVWLRAFQAGLATPFGGL